MKFRVKDIEPRLVPYVLVELEYLALTRDHGDTNVGLHFEKSASKEPVHPLLISVEEAICLRDGLNAVLRNINAEEQN